ncbi:DUF481 domain-containing protein [Pontiella sulfatireligans]|uniref:Porin domain-containing protein n=1 Tax=Pontiella sulfatireligans TaxID=2750658 RepID=A0A6C2UQW1_9BACT|nr:DUF481 domain-containing protein [Pontiella sulfatireligans]VGO21684.1 hypothetical protein SCARR_03758 [Pontiella sulfatireligans]
MKYGCKILSACFLFLLPCALMAQQVPDDLGFEVGVFRIVPEVFAQGSYDSRVKIDESGDAQDDFYGEMGVGLSFDNTDAQYQLSGSGNYGYRKYDKYTSSDGDFYDASASFGSRQNPLKYGISGTAQKTLDYDTDGYVEERQDLESILTSEESTSYSATADISYERRLTPKTTLVPAYAFSYYYQDFETESDAESHTHQAGLLLGYDYSERTVLTLAGYGSFQSNDEEDGQVGTIAVGARSSVTDKTSWSAEMGYSAADYEDSGSDQSVFSSVNVNWQATEKVSVYVRGGADYEPGYGGGSARKVYRLGYGASWNPLLKWSFSVQALHDYEEEIDDEAEENPSNEEWRHFFSAQAQYSLTKRMAMALIGSYNKDEEDDDQMIVSLRATYRY